MNVADTKRVRATAACLCLLAVALLYAPLAAAALIANGVGCCASGFCPIKAHHHHQQTPSQQESQPMDCGHDMAGMTVCSMSCCPDQGRPAVVPAAFVLPPVAIVPAACETVRPVLMTSSTEISQALKPLSPPPRLATSLL